MGQQRGLRDKCAYSASRACFVRQFFIFVLFFLCCVLENVKIAAAKPSQIARKKEAEQMLVVYCSARTTLSRENYCQQPSQWIEKLPQKSYGNNINDDSIIIITIFCVDRTVRVTFEYIWDGIVALSNLNIKHIDSEVDGFHKIERVLPYTSEFYAAFS